MPKIRTNRSAAKRFKQTGTGKLKRFKACASHLLSKKTPKRRRYLRRPTLVDPTELKRIKRLIPT